jgi:adenylate cyclase
MLANKADFGEDDAMDELLNGLEGEAREARRVLVERLSEEGFSPEELRAAAAENRLALLPVSRLLGGRYTAAEVESMSGTPATLMLRIRRLLGLPEAGEQDRVFGDEDIAAARSTRRFLEAGLSEEALSEITRVLGESMSRLAATTTAAFADSFLQPGDSEAAVAARFAARAEELMPALAPVLSAALTAHLRESVGRGMIGRSELEAGQVAGAQLLGVAFADLVGFTRLGGQIEVSELGSVAGKLAELAADVARPPVRLVKTIGDAAMFVSPEPAPLVEAALALLGGAAEAELPSLRAGLALGSTIQRAGDYYGHAVNLASRVTGAARPDSVLCTQEVRDAAAEPFEWSFAGNFRLKGIHGALPLHRARHPGAADADAASQPRADRPRKRASR